MGVGVTVYFKMLKFLIILFLWFCFLSIPSYLFYYYGSDHADKNLSIKYAFSSFSLGNLGQAKNACNVGDVNLEDTLSFYCSYGYLD